MKKKPTFTDEELGDLEKMCLERINIFSAEYYKPRSDHKRWQDRIVHFTVILGKLKEMRDTV